MRRSRSAPVLLAALSALACGDAARGGRAPSGADGAGALVVATPEWAGATDLEWRAVAATRSARWLVRVPGSAPREVDLVARESRAAEAGAWERAVGDVVRASESRARSASLAGAFVRDGRLVLAGGDVATRHAKVLDVSVSPDGRAVAVLSADGAAPSLAPSLGGGANAAGAHAVEVFDAASGRRTALVPLSLTSKSLALAGHWSGEPSLLIYSDALSTRLCFVRLP